MVNGNIPAARGADRMSDSAVHIGEPDSAARAVECQAFVIDPQQIHQVA